ncbi:MAG: hypothetical protein ACREO2_02245 [Arenimonas sp.]
MDMLIFAGIIVALVLVAFALLFSRSGTRRGSRTVNNDNSGSTNSDSMIYTNFPSSSDSYQSTDSNSIPQDASCNSDNWSSSDSNSSDSSFSCDSGSDSGGSDGGGGSD